MPEPAMYPVEIDGRGFIVDTSRAANVAESFRRTSVQLLNTQQNIDKGESALTTPEVWRRTYQSWHHGEGQKFADRDDGDLFRYARGRGIDPWEKWQLSLLPDTIPVQAQMSGLEDTLEGFTLGDDLLCVTTANHYRIGLKVGPTGEPDFAGSVPTHMPSHGTSIGSNSAVFVQEDKTVWRATREPTLGNLWYDKIGSLAATGLPAGNPAAVGFHNGFLLCAFTTGEVIDFGAYFQVEGNVPGGAWQDGPFQTVNWTAVTTIPGGFQPVSFASGQNAVYLGGNYGNDGVVLRFTISSETAALTFGGTAAELPTEERVAGLGSYLGYVAIGTDHGFRLAASSDQGLTYGPLIETPGAVRHFETGGRFLYFTMSKAWWVDEPRAGGGSAFNFNFNSDFSPGGQTVKVSGLGRADLSEFVTDLQPAYATDLMTPIDEAFYGEVNWVHRVNGRIVFGTGGGGIFAETDTYVPFGVVELSGWTFNVSDDKIGLYTQVRNRPGSRGQGGLFYTINESPSLWRQLVPDTPLPPTEDTPLIRYDLTGAKFGSIRLAGIIEPPKTPVKDLTVTPVLLGVELRATYQRGKASEWQVPCMLRDEVETDSGSVEARDVVDDYEHLLRLVQDGKVFTYKEGSEQWQVYATDFAWVPTGRSAYDGWQGTFTLVFREIK